MISKTKNTKQFEDRNQNFWHLASIQGASQGLGSILIGGQIAKDVGAGAALVSVLIGNIIL